MTPGRLAFGPGPVLVIQRGLLEVLGQALETRLKELRELGWPLDPGKHRDCATLPRPVAIGLATNQVERFARSPARE